MSHRLLTNLPVKIRKATDADINFIFNSWLKSYRNSDFAKSISNPVYFTEHHKVLEQLTKTTEILIACNAEDEVQIYGYIAAEKIDDIFCLHYIYIKHTFRNMGIGKELLNSFEHNTGEPGCYTHNTRMAEKLAPKYNMIYHPYLLINQREEVNNVSGESEESPSTREEGTPT